MNDTIDLGSEPKLSSWGIEVHGIRQHNKRGIFEWDTSRVKLLTIKEYRQSKHKGVVAANIILLDYLRNNTDKIPSHWKGKVVLFFGTILVVTPTYHFIDYDAIPYLNIGKEIYRGWKCKPGDNDYVAVIIMP